MKRASLLAISKKPKGSLASVFISLKQCAILYKIKIESGLQ